MGKFANSLRLKIAVRLLHADKEKAFSIAQDVMNSSAGILSGLNDDFVYSAGSKFYHFNDQVSLGQITKHLTEFMIENRDRASASFSTRIHLTRGGSSLFRCTGSESQ